MKCPDCQGKNFHTIYKDGVKVGMQCDNCRKALPVKDITQKGKNQNTENYKINQ